MVAVAFSGDSLHYTNDILTDIDRYVFLKLLCRSVYDILAAKYIPYNWLKKMLRYRGTPTSSCVYIIFPVIDKIQIYFIFIGKI